MGRSQRHKVFVQATDSAGKGLSEKQPAAVYVIQFANSQAFAVPVAPSGGPLQGSSMAGYPPTLIPPPIGSFLDADAKAGVPGEFTDPGQFNLSGNPRYTSLPAPEDSGGVPGPGPGPDPLPGEEPVLNSINPSSARLGDPDLVMNVTGNRFTDTSVIYFNGGPEPTEFVSDAKITTVVKPSTATVVGDFPVWVQQGSYQTTQKTFSFTDPNAVQARVLPLGPIALERVEDDDNGIALIVPDGTDIQVGDTVYVEATGNSSTNGSYEVLSVDGDRVVVDNTYELAATIEAKGRVTVTAEA